jgi:hypothetical protein
MDFLGAILAEPDPPGINNGHWIEMIREHPNLGPVPPREGINPFTRKPTVFHAPADSARVVVGGKEVGSMEWAVDDSNRINVYGDPEVVTPLAREIAEALGGRFVEESCTRTVTKALSGPRSPSASCRSGRGSRCG